MHRRMWKLCCSGVILTILAQSSSLSSYAEDRKRIGMRQLHKQMREAHTPEQLHAVAQYLRQEQTWYQVKAEAERREIVSLRDRSKSMPSKYPTPLESANHLYEFYNFKAEEFGQMASEYEEKIGMKNRLNANDIRK